MAGGRFSVEAIFRAVDKMSAPVAQMSRGVDSFTRRSASNLGRMDRAFGSVHSKAVRVAGVIGAAGIAAGGGLYALSRSALSVEEALSKVGTVVTPAMGSVQAALEKTKAAALDWSRQHVASAEEFLAANYNMASAGLNSTQALAGTRSALTLATATMGDATTAGNLLATVYNNLGDKTRSADTEMQRLSGVLAKTQALFQIADLGQLNEGLKMGAPSAIQFGASVEGLSTAIGALNTAGLQGSMAGTAYSAAMRQMSKASKSLGFEIARTASGGIDFVGTIGAIERKFGSFEKMTDRQKAAFQKAFGDEGVRSIALLMGKYDQLAESQRRVTDSMGADAVAQRTIEAARTQQMKIFGNQLRSSMIAFGDAILPVMDELRPEIDKVISSVRIWTDANKGLVASNIVETVRAFRDNLPEIVTWTRRIAIGIGVFYAYGAAIKVAQASMIGLRAIVATATGVKWLYVAVMKRAAMSTTAATLANRQHAAAMAFMRGETLATSGALGGMRGALNASKLGTSINGVTSKLGKAGLLGAALGVGVAIGSWLNHTFELDKKLTGLFSKMTGLDDKLNANGKRYTSRAEAFKFVPSAPRYPGVSPAVPMFDATGGAGEASSPVTPLLVPPGQMDARALASEIAVQLDGRQQVDVNVTASGGASAEVTKTPTPQRSRLVLPSSGSRRRGRR